MRCEGDVHSLVDWRDRPSMTKQPSRKSRSSLFEVVSRVLWPKNGKKTTMIAHYSWASRSLEWRSIGHQIPNKECRHKTDTGTELRQKAGFLGRFSSAVRHRTASSFAFDSRPSVNWTAWGPILKSFPHFVGLSRRRPQSSQPICPGFSFAVIDD